MTDNVVPATSGPPSSTALGYFAPAIVAEHWDSGRAVVPPPGPGGDHLECRREFGRRYLGGAPFLASFVLAAAKVNLAADETGLPADSEFRSAFGSCIEWASRTALAQSQQSGGGSRSRPRCRAGTGAGQGCRSSPT